MNAAGILEDVADTYSRLQTVAAEALVVNESLDGYTRSEQRVWCHFEAPDRVRIEHKGDNRMVTVRGGGEHVTYFGVGNHFARHAVDPGTMRLPGDFSPDMPMIGEPPFLFRRIAERVKASEVVEQSPGKVLVRVDYDSPQLPFASTGPLLFSVDTEAKLISRVEVEVTHRRPHDGGVHSSKQVLVITRAVANEPIEPETFVFVPPPDAEEMQPGIRSGGFGGGGGLAWAAAREPDGSDRVAHGAMAVSWIRRASCYRASNFPSNDAFRCRRMAGRWRSASDSRHRPVRRSPSFRCLWRRVNLQSPAAAVAVSLVLLVCAARRDKKSMTASAPFPAG